MFFDAHNLVSDELALTLRSTVMEKHGGDSVPAYYFRIRHNGQDIGWLDLRAAHVPDTRRYGNLSYMITKPFRGHRFAEKAVRLVLPLAGQHGLRYLRIHCRTDNLPSVRTCERLGAVLDCTLLFPDNSLYYSYRLDIQP